MNSKKLQTKEYGISTLKGAIGAIPFVGTFLNEVSFEARSRIKQERVNNFIEEFGQLMSDKGQEPDFLKLDSTQIGDILEEIVISVSKTSSEHKKHIFKQILLKQVTSASIDTDETQRFINITNEITSHQFNILEVFSSLSDNVLKYKIQIIEYQNTIDTLEQWNRDFKSGNYGDKATFDKNEIEILRLVKLVARKRNALKRGTRNPNHHETFSLSREIYITEVQDLMSKGLLFDFAIKTKLIDPFIHFGITNLGRTYMEYLIS